MQRRVWSVAVLAIAGMAAVGGTAASAKPKSADIKQLKAACEAQELNTAIAGCTQLIAAKPAKAARPAAATMSQKVPALGQPITGLVPPGMSRGRTPITTT